MGKSMKRSNDVLNVWKGLAIFGVVFFHCRIPFAELDNLCQALLRFSVPLFFMVSGYFSWDKESDISVAKIKRHMAKIGKLCLVSSALAFLFLEALGLLSGGPGRALEKLGNFFSAQNLAIWICFNQDPFINILWFVFAQLYAYAILLFLCRRNLMRAGYRLMVGLLAALALLADILPIFGVSVTLFYYRNFLFLGLPYMLLGYWVHENKQCLLQRVPQRRIILLILAASLEVALESALLGRRDVYLGTLFQVIGIFLLSLGKEEMAVKCVLKTIGEKYTGFIFVVHYLVLILLEDAAERLPLGKTGLGLYGWSKVLLVFGISLAGAAIWDRVAGRWKSVHVNKERE